MVTAVHDVDGEAQLLRRWRCGRIVVKQGRLDHVSRRLWPYVASKMRALWDQRFPPKIGDRCELYYHAPWDGRPFLVLGYVRSGQTTSLASFYLATLVLDEIARIKNSQFIVAELSNARISERLMQRWGWIQHCKQESGRHFIKRFYGSFPPIAPSWRHRMSSPR